MKVGDLVKWIGFPGASQPPDQTGPRATGIIIEVSQIGIPENPGLRITVAWGGGSIGNRLYPQTIEVISECR